MRPLTVLAACVAVWTAHGHTPEQAKDAVGTWEHKRSQEM